MKNFIIIIFFFASTFSLNAEIVYLDMNLILKKSEIGQSLDNKINKLKKIHITKYKEIEKKLIDKEKKLIAQRNILDEDEFEKKLDLLTKEIKKFRSNKKLSENELNKIRIDDTKEILKLLNPIVANYVNKNSISLVLPKKNIIVGKKNLDITDKIINLLDKEAENLKF